MVENENSSKDRWKNEISFNSEEIELTLNEYIRLRLNDDVFKPEIKRECFFSFSGVIHKRFVRKKNPL